MLATGRICTNSQLDDWPRHQTGFGPEYSAWEAAVSPLHDPADILYQTRLYQIYNRELTNHCIQIITCFETRF